MNVKTIRILSWVFMFLSLYVMSSILTYTEASTKKEKNNQISLDFGPGVAPVWSGAIHYVRRINNQWSWGLGVDYAWEDNQNSFDKNIWDVIGVEVFARFKQSHYLCVDLGPTVFRYSPGDDTGESGSFFGGYVGVMIGYRFLYLAPHAKIGIATDSNGTSFGVILSPLVIRIVIQF